MNAVSLGVLLVKQRDSCDLERCAQDPREMVRRGQITVKERGK